MTFCLVLAKIFLMSSKLLIDILNIPSPTYHEKKLSQYLLNSLEKTNPTNIYKKNDSIIFCYGKDKEKKTIGLVGHLDVVPDYFEAYEDEGKIYGAGASDMKAGVAAFVDLILNHHHELKKAYNVMLILYTKEERTALSENGLFELIDEFPEIIKQIDCAIVGEPTDNSIQIGCVGSLHLTATITGKSSHSARPWHGENALYKAIPLIEKIKRIEPKKVHLFGVDFLDVIEITESESEKGRTSIPGMWSCNINYRFSPDKSEKEALEYLTHILNNLELSELSYKVKDSVYAGKVIENSFFKDMVKRFLCPIQAKQAWTDVAQLGNIGVPAFNFGPGNQSQAHKKNEYIVLSQYNKYLNLIKKLLD